MYRHLKFPALLCLVWLASTAPGFAVDQHSPERLERVAFGSCNQVKLEQPLWPAIVAWDPDLWIWTGDIIYADTSVEARMRAMYEEQKARPGYRGLLAHCPVIGVWDDHDYGLNGGGKEFKAREMSQRALLDFLDEPSGSPRRSRAGVYASYTWGPADARTKIILLDARYHRERPGAEADTLGAEQWRWLESELRDSDASLNLIVSSYQVVASDHSYEKWANFPHSRARLLALIRENHVPGVIFISGDRHIGEISRETRATAYPLYDITASGLTHSWSSFPGEPNERRVSEVITDLHFGAMSITWGSETVDLELQLI
ncbi:MAG: alkaline phosphatase D family protein, partial [Pseudomonadales bacterium]